MPVKTGKLLPAPEAFRDAPFFGNFRHLSSDSKPDCFLPRSRSRLFSAPGDGLFLIPALMAERQAILKPFRLKIDSFAVYAVVSTVYFFP